MTVVPAVAAPPARLRERAFGLGVALASSGLATLLTAGLRTFIQPAVAPLFFAAVVVSSWYGGLGPGLLATALSAFATECFFYPPPYTFDVGALLRVSTFVFVALLVSSLNARARRAQREAEALASARTALLRQEQTAREEAETANRAKDEFLATLSHELRTPLNAMLGWLWWLRTGGLDAPRAARALETVERNTRLLAQLIEDLLDVSRIITGKLRLEIQPLDLPAVIEAAVEAVRPAASAKSIRLDVAVDGTVQPVAGDPDRLQQVMWNLLSNAIKFTPENGRVDIRLARAGDRACITCRDTGKGVSPELLPYIFDRFRQAEESRHRVHGGLGLGLAIVRHLVEVHGGSVHAESGGAGQGTTFTVLLPLQPRGPARRSPTSAGTIARLDGVRVLVVDDEPDARESLALVLRQCGAEVTPAGSVQEALAAYDRQLPDVVVSDIRLPGEDGYDLIRHLRLREASTGRTTPAIALTAYPRVEDRAGALSAGYQMHVPKPVAPRELAAVIASLADREDGAA
jgi:signal transduction histidine kinase/CheY-like chemotaxis protein